MNSANCKITFAIAALAILGVTSVPRVAAQTPTVPEPPRTRVEPTRRVPPAAPVVTTAGRGDGELRVAADPNVNIKFCVSEGNLKINGWDRSEVRVFVRSGRKFTIRVLERDSVSGKANWVWIAPALADGATPAPAATCLSGDSIEIDVPRGATVDLEGRSTDVSIDSIKKVRAKIVEGNISLNNISGGINAVALQGDLLVESSAGAISLESTTGNIVAYDVTPGQIGELFRAKTNSGAISIQRVEHRQIEANTITGSVAFDGKFLVGGIYNFKTSNGSIRLQLPAETSCSITASYGFGSFKSALPMTITYETVSPGGKNLNATIGKGEMCNLKLTTTSGSINIAKPAQ